MKTIKRKLLLVTALLALLLFAVACGGAQDGTGDEPGTDVPTQEGEVPAGEEPPAGEETPADEGEAPGEETAADGDLVTLRTHWGSEPPSLDPSLATDNVSIWTLGQMFVGLTRFNTEGEVEPWLATDWEVSDDGLVYTFNLRDDIPWVRLNPDSGEFENLGPVTAQDIEYAVLRTLDPATASDYAYTLYVLEGGQEFNEGEPGDSALRDAVGVEAIDDTTIEFTLREPASYFPSITGMWITFPQYQEAIEENPDSWTEPGTIVTNGPYALQEWQHSAQLRLVKNPHWPDADAIQIDVIEGPIIQEASTALSLYEAGELDYLGEPGNGPPLPDLERIRNDAELGGQLIISPDLCTYYYGFVMDKPPFDDPLVRHAFSAAIDRQLLIDTVLKGEQRPAHSFAPPGVFGNVADNTEIGAYMIMDDYAAQIEQARAWLEEAGYPMGEGIEAILMHNTSEAHAQIAQAIQAMWQEAFPSATVQIENQEWGVFLSTLDPSSPIEGKPHVFRQGWCADYPDAQNFLSIFTPASGNNYVGFNNDAYNELLAEAVTIEDEDERADLYAQAEAILVDEEAAIAPIYYYTQIRMEKPHLQEAVLSPLGADPVWQWSLDPSAR